MSPPLPPRLTERLLGLLLGGLASKRYILGDLREDYAERVALGGRRRATLWYVFESLSVGARMWWSRGRGRRVVRPARHVTTNLRDLMATDLRQAVRFLRRRPAFSSAIVLTVALAIAATTTAYAVVSGVLLKPLPYDSADRLVVVWEHNVPRSDERNVVSPANFLTWCDQARSFTDLAGLMESSATLLVSGEPERVGAVLASASYFALVGARPLVGRFYTEAEDQEGAEATAVLSEAYWRGRFGADRAVIGRSVVMNGGPVTILGVLPAAFDFPVEARFGETGSRDIWVPLGFGESARTASGRWLQVLGGLGPGATVASAQAEMSALAARLRDEFPGRQTGWDVNVVGLVDQIVGDVRRTLLVAFGAVCFVLLIACANVANLLLTRATERQQEIAVRAALGAGRGRLVRQLMLESLLLSAVGGMLGIALARWALAGLVSAAPDLPRLEAIGLDAAVVGFAFLATLVAALLFGLAPALYIAGDAASWLRERGPAAAGRRGARRLRGTLVVAQVSLSLVLLIGAGLLVRSMMNRLAVGTGFDTERLLTADLTLPSATYEDRTAVFYEELVERVTAVPGVEAASAITFVPLSGLGSATSLWVTDRPVPPPGQIPSADIRWVHRDYHRALGIPLRAGRLFDATDHTGSPLRVVISEAAARELWPGEDALGRQLAMPWGGDTLIAEVIGIVGDIRHSGPDTPARAMIYWEHRQFSPFSNMTIIARTTGAPAAVAAAVRRVVQDMDPALPLYNVRTMDTLFGQVLARSRFITVSLGLFAVLALTLAAIGIYGVVAYATEQRTREIGIRMALGADRWRVLHLVLSQGMALLIVALGLGAASAIALTRLVRGLLFEVDATDPMTFAAMVLLLGAVGLFACWLPARRASRIDPVDAIRME